MSSRLFLALHVPTGLEDYALDSVMDQLERGSVCVQRASSVSRVLVSAPVQSSHVLIEFPTLAPLRDAVDAYLRGSLWAAYGAYVCVCAEDLEDARKTLEDDWRVHDRETGARGSRHARSEDAEQLPALQTTTRAEDLLMSRFIHLLNANLPSLRVSETLLPSFESPERGKTFRATLCNPSRLLPLTTLRRQDIERTIGDHIGETWFFEKDWNVKLEGAEVDVHVRLCEGIFDMLPWEGPRQPEAGVQGRIRGLGFPKQLSMLIGVSLPPARIPMHRTVPLGGATPLSPPIAHLLTLMHPLFHSNLVRHVSVVLDPCTGYSSIPREMLALVQQRQLSIAVLASDISFPSLSSSLQTHVSLVSALQISLFQPLPFRTASINGVVSDLPWGTRHLSAVKIGALYPAMMRRLEPVVPVGGVMVLMSGAVKAMDGALRGRRGWEVAGWREVAVGGRWVGVWVIQRVDS